MDIRKLFLLADDALTNVVDQITPEYWDRDIPVTTSSGETQTLREIVNYHAYDEAWVPDVLAGKTAAEVGTTYDGDLLGEDPKKSWHDIVMKAQEAVESLSDEDLKKTVHLSYGDFPAQDYLWHITTFRMYRAVEIARFIHVDDKLPDELVTGMYAILEKEAPMLRKMGVFDEAIEVPGDATLQEKLLAISGRQPKA